MTGTQASLPALARHSRLADRPCPWGRARAPAAAQTEQPGQALQGRATCSAPWGAWKCRGKFRDCSGRRGRNTAIPLALVTFCLFKPAARLIWNLERL